MISQPNSNHTRRKSGVALAIVFLATMLATVTACSNQQIYDAIQENNKMDCEDKPEYTREKCLRQVENSYEEYEEKRQEVLKDSD